MLEKKYKPIYAILTLTKLDKNKYKYYKIYQINNILI